MIDYDKLKKVHELAEKLSQQSNYYVNINCNFDSKINCYELSTHELSMEYRNIDELIHKTTELTQLNQPKPKYEVGQKVWYVSKAQKLQETQILDFSEQESTIYEPFYYCCVSPLPVPESILYPTKRDLIEAQIKYWAEESIKAGLTVRTQSTATLPAECFNVPNQHGTTTSVSLYPPSEQPK